ncbi:SCO2322 family protein [Streptomyces yaizuensis]|uniref:SCO2322 family protein n=1 Tax=Streptomyces yaizuensis TaxID=2989713 RepID=A0ABQ5NUU4_9ACTN|nr:SCO2322 family protein [Streptomyces sp. YSPA8]GLF93923.1 SCO2322 family protein [Streptomyces sp. YSPA8]
MSRAARTGAARALGAVLALTAALGLLGAGPAQAAGYRYWSFWQTDGGGWAYATEGPATHRPDDGSVVGFRFAVSENSADSARPRQTPGFGAVCGTTAEKSGAKRVALVIDPGTAADAPSGETPPQARTACASVPSSATTADALASVAKPLRYNGQALLCAISGYPRTGCGDQVGTEKGAEKGAEKASPTASDDTDSGGPSLGVLLGAAAIAALGAAALWQSRRRR